MYYVLCLSIMYHDFRVLCCLNIMNHVSSVLRVSSLTCCELCEWRAMYYALLCIMPVLSGKENCFHLRPAMETDTAARNSCCLPHTRPGNTDTPRKTQWTIAGRSLQHTGTLQLTYQYKTPQHTDTPRKTLRIFVLVAVITTKHTYTNTKWDYQYSGSDHNLTLRDWA